MYRGEKDAASREGTETQNCPFEGQETSDLFFPPLSHVTFPRNSLVLVQGFEQQNPV